MTIRVLNVSIEMFITSDCGLLPQGTTYLITNLSQNYKAVCLAKILVF